MRFHYAVKPGVGFIASGIYERGHMHVAVHNKTGSCVYKFFHLSMRGNMRLC